MELKRYIDEKIKIEKGKNLFETLTISILNLEEALVEKRENSSLVKAVFINTLYDCFSLIKDLKIEINNSELQEVDLDYWKNNIHVFKSRINDPNIEVYLYSIRNSLKYLLQKKKDKQYSKAYLFEIIIKLFLSIDFYGFSINKLLEESVN